MTGGLIQLVSVGAQDIYITGNPIVTFFKTVYRRHTNFATETITQLPNRAINFGTTTDTLITRNGDLLTGLYLQATLPSLTSSSTTGVCQRWIDNIGHYLIQSVHVSIGGQIIDTHTGDWLEIWSQLTVPAGKMKGYLEMIGQDPRNPLGMNTGLQRDLGESATILGRTIYVPLQFWFCRHIGVSLPLIALQYSEVKIHLTLRRLDELVVNYIHGSTAPALESLDLLNANICAEYIYLDTDERRRFAQIPHEYLIEQVQSVEYNVDGNSQSTSVLLPFKHTVKELIWVSRHSAATSNGLNQWCNYTTTPAVTHITGNLGTGIDLLDNLGEVNALDDVQYNSSSTNIMALTSHNHVRPSYSSNQTAFAELFLNGNSRFGNREGAFLNWIQCRDRHTNNPLSPGINLYSFAYRPEQYQPSGVCNFSRITTVKLDITFNQGKDLYQSTGFFGSSRTLQVYATNYNVLRVMSGMAGLAYSSL